MNVRRIPSQLLKESCILRRFDVRLAAIACVLLIGAVFGSSCGSTPPPRQTSRNVDPEAQILSVLSRLEAAMEQEQLNAVLAVHHPNYRDLAGRDYAALREHLENLFGRLRGIQITRNVSEVRVSGSQARVTESFHTRATSSSGAPVEWRGTNRIQLRRRQGTWLITSWDVWEPSRT